MKLQTYCSFLVQYGGNLEKSINAKSVECKASLSKNTSSKVSTRLACDIICCLTHTYIHIYVLAKVRVGRMILNGTTIIFKFSINTMYTLHCGYH